jgi:hypothetical protein
MRRSALALVCALIPGSAWAQDPYAQGQSAYDQSQLNLFYSTVQLRAAQFGSGAGCGVISPGLGMQMLSDLLDYTQSQVGFSQDTPMISAYQAAFKYKACSFWRDHPDAVAQLRQLGQATMNAHGVFPMPLSPP